MSYAGSDLGYDLYSLEDIILRPGVPVKARTGIAVEGPPGWGFVLGDRSSMAARGVTYAGGRIDAGYRGELLVCLINVNQPVYSVTLERDNRGRLRDCVLASTNVDVAINRGDKIIQMSPFQSMTGGAIVVVDDLSDSDRAHRGFGSTGR